MQLTGQELADMVALHRNASTNWARLTGGPEDHYLARVALLDEIAACGRFSRTPPEWMTSPKPGTDAYITVGRIVLLLREEEYKGRPWHAFNAVAPRRGGPKPAAKPASLPAKSASWSEEQIADLRKLSGKQLARRLWVSGHCLDRTRDRGLFDVDTDSETITSSLKAMITADGHVAPLPGWANAAGVGGMALLCDSDRVALPISPDLRNLDPLSMAATTCLPEAWVKATLHDLPLTELLAHASISSSCLTDGETEPEFRKLMAANGQLVVGDDGARVQAAGRAFKLRPATGGGGWTLTR